MRAPYFADLYRGIMTAAIPSIPERSAVQHASAIARRRPMPAAARTQAGTLRKRFAVGFLAWSRYHAGMQHLRGFTLAIAYAAIGLTGCGGGDGAATPPPAVT